MKIFIVLLLLFFISPLFEDRIPLEPPPFQVPTPPFPPDPGTVIPLEPPPFQIPPMPEDSTVIEELPDELTEEILK